jgi:two-component system, LuxR family, response regulator FixJ
MPVSSDYDIEEIHYRPILNRDRVVAIAEGDLKIREQLGAIFRLEGFITRVQAFPSDINQIAPDADVLVADFDGLGPSAAGVIQQFRQNRKATVVVALIEHECVAAAVDLMRAGAYDVIVKPVDTERLLSSVKDALRRDVQLGVPNAGERSVVIRGFKSLTDREREVLQLIVEGRSNKAAANQLGISPRTVEVHRSHVMQKLGAANTADLLRIVLTS